MVSDDGDDVGGSAAGRAGVRRLQQHAQVRAFDHPMRHRIVARLGQGPATVSMLADEFGRPPGTVGHHTKVLEGAGLVEVVRTRDVNGITERWLGRTAATFEFPPEVGAMRKAGWMLEEVARAKEAGATCNAARDGRGLDPLADLLTVRIARIPDERAHEWARRLLDLAVEFAGEPVGGETSYTLAVAITPGVGIAEP